MSCKQLTAEHEVHEGFHVVSAVLQEFQADLVRLHQRQGRLPVTVDRYVADPPCAPFDGRLWAEALQEVQRQAGVAPGVCRSAQLL